MPKIKITKPVVIDGRPYAVKDTPEVSEADARYVCAIGKAEPIDEAETAKSEPKTPRSKPAQE